MSAQFAIVLHHHLPFIRHPQHAFHLEERWLYEAILETYLPLIQAWRSLERDGLSFCFTASLTPTLVNMLRDELLIGRFRAHLARLLELADKERARTVHDPAPHRLAQFYFDRLTGLGQLFEALGGDIVGEYRRLMEAGYLELVTCTATHGFLPLMNGDRVAMRAQIEIACRDFERHLGRRPQGIWLAECGYVPKVVDELLAEAGLRYFFVDTHGIEHASSAPVYGIYAPLQCPHTGVAAFGRDAQSSRQVWSSHEGYPGDYDYREYYRDIGWDLGMDYIAPYIHPDGIRLNTGLKYHRVTGPTDLKDWYDPQVAQQRASEHAAHFLRSRAEQLAPLAGQMDRPPLVVSPYDAELFGHWWFEGPWFLEALVRHLNSAGAPADLRMTTPARYLVEHPIQQAAWPEFSSWGGGGYAKFWCDEPNEWVYPYLHHAAQRMAQLAAQYRDDHGLAARILTQAARELLLAQGSDWAFIMQTGTTVAYAVQRTREHLAAFHELCDALTQEQPPLAWLEARERQWCIFPELDFRIYAER